MQAAASKVKGGQTQDKRELKEPRMELKGKKKGAERKLNGSWQEAERELKGSRKELKGSWKGAERAQNGVNRGQYLR